MADKAATAYRTISEAGEETGLPAHVLRFWESKFSQLRPVKRAGGRRLYRPQDISLILGLKHLLYEEGFTIKGAQKYVKEHGVAQLITQMEQGQGPSLGPVAPAEPVSEPASSPAAAVPDSATPLFDHAASASGGHADQSHRIQAAVNQLRAAKKTLDAVRQTKRT
jgi:DNA-binding transcriptional MerR regulator